MIEQKIDSDVKFNLYPLLYMYCQIIFKMSIGTCFVLTVWFHV